MRYIHSLAVLVIAVAIVVGGYRMDQALSRNTLDGHTINIAGAQRMLSQRIVVLTQMLETANPDEVDQIRDVLRDAHARMLSGHKYLTQPQNDAKAPAYRTQELVAIYSEAGADLQRRVDEFLANTAAILDLAVSTQRAADNVDLSKLNSLLGDLDKAAGLYELNAKQEIEAAELSLKLSILVALVVLFAVVVFVFGPISKRATRILQKSEMELQQRSDLLSRSFNIARMGYWVNSVDRPDELWISNELARLYKIGLSEKWLPISDLRERAQDQNNDLISSAAKVCRETGKPQYLETRIRCADGSFIDTSTSIAAQFDDNETIISITGVVRDITEELNARNTIAATVKRLEKSSSDLREAQQLGSIAMWQMPIGSKELVLDEDAFGLMRYDYSKIDEYRERIGDKSSAGTHLKQLCVGDSFSRMMEKSGQVYETGKAGRVNLRMRRGDGTIADLAVRIKLQRDKSGKPKTLFGTLQDISEAKDAQRQLEQLAYYDHLTGLSNRALFMRRLEKACAAAKKDKTASSAIVLIDLENFKEINDGLGHQAGDDFLCEVGRRLSHVAGPSNLVARLGGDEFAVIVNGASPEETSCLVHEMLSSISVPVRVGEAEAIGGGSAGITMIPSDTMEASEAMRFSDLALYSAKESGKNRSSFFSPDMSSRLQARLSLSRDLRAAIANNELETHFQPIVSGMTGRVIGFETLMRWNHQSRGWISPSEFIPIAESSHLIGDIGAFAIRDACDHAVEMNSALEGDIEVAVNVSAAQLWHGDVEQMVAKALETSGLAPHLLCIELTESVFVGDSMDRVEALLKRLKERGIQLALDDFGTGYSSLGYLNHLPFDKLKIDRSFVAGADVSAKRFQVLEGIVGLARGLGMQVVAEGVETASELSAIQALRCDAIQGFYFGRPEPQSKALSGVEAIHSNAQAYVLPDLEGEIDALDAVEKTGLGGKRKRGAA
ncbi:MAG: EAL domain-containing protein [Pseudomonadota bacterium]